MATGDRDVRIRLGQMAPDLSFARNVTDIGVPASIEGTEKFLYEILPPVDPGATTIQVTL